MKIAVESQRGSQIIRQIRFLCFELLHAEHIWRHRPQPCEESFTGSRTNTVGIKGNDTKHFRKAIIFSYFLHISANRPVPELLNDTGELFGILAATLLSSSCRTPSSSSCSVRSKLAFFALGNSRPKQDACHPTSSTQDFSIPVRVLIVSVPFMPKRSLLAGKLAVSTST